MALGAHSIGMDDMSASRSNASIGELLEDCASVVSRLCDTIVVRHYEGDAAARMAATSVVPVINAGDGWNEHPTQALIDIYAMRRGIGTLRGKSIAFGGDPRGPRRALAHSALAFRSSQRNRILSASPIRTCHQTYLSALAEKPNSPAHH